MSCKNCRHYSFYRMITEGPYSYSGPIPCLSCSRFTFKEDKFEPAQEEKPCKFHATRIRMNCSVLDDICADCDEECSLSKE